MNDFSIGIGTILATDYWKQDGGRARYNDRMVKV